MAQTQELSAYWTAQADAVSIWGPPVEEASKPQWDNFKYGLCAWCSKGLEDKSDLVVTEDGYGNTVTLCSDCYKV